ncbi:hypothetical protein H257_17836 [Aphanomyces astaci]|uniref:Uncharacterized protein n=1 Tax=Aphanomyces astaci TaxID=112090 RepID=W4FF28_APHAT|nr:hypothetical protein H257_17836 [Aphanomyces astaci]ETV65441.1 hypothetical protein H257_17836 [Aphanomyces astaci]|eukprot:XP_009845084.1 hypothetical protein H257_17836 [Aphanomyces astaci]
MLFKGPQDASDTVIEERTSNTRLFHSITTGGAFVNSLQGHFFEADRFIMVMRQVDDDEMHACGPMLRQRHYRSWIEVRPVSPTHILMCHVSHLSHEFRAHDGFLSMAELAVLVGIDVTGIDDDDKDAYVRREFVRRGNDDLVPWRQYLTGLLQASLQQDTTRI